MIAGVTEPWPLRGRNALVTGGGRRAGIGHAVAGRLRGLGASVALHHHRAHDAAQPWGADDLDAALADLRDRPGEPDAVVVDLAGDLSAEGAPEALVDVAVDAVGPLDVLVANHARSGGDGALGELTAAMLDGHWAVDARSVILLTQAFAGRHDDARPGGRVVLLTSGQQHGPMPGEVAYAAAKGALASVTATLADPLAERGLTLNTVNPGPVDTGYLTGEAHARVAARFPGGRWGRPDDPARLIAWLCTDDAAWITGQVLDTEGGFRR